MLCAMYDRWSEVEAMMSARRVHDFFHVLKLKTNVCFYNRNPIVFLVVKFTTINAGNIHYHCHLLDVYWNNQLLYYIIIMCFSNNISHNRS